MKSIAAVLVLITFAVLSANAQTQSGTSSAPSATPVAESNGRAAGSGQATTNAPTPAPTGETQPPDALARKYVDLWNTGDVDQIKAFPPFVMNSVAGRVVVSSGMLLSVIANWRKSMPDLHFEVKDTLVQGNKVAMRTVFTGTYKAHLFPFTADPKSIPDRRIRAADMLMFDIKDGRIVEIWEEYDVAKVQVQMGAKWCMDVMSTAAPPIGSTPEPNPGSNSSSSPSPKP